MDRLVGLINLALKNSEVDASSLASASYRTILEASLHSRDVWLAFVSVDDISETHRKLVLSDVRESLRGGVCQAIEGICGELPRYVTLTACVATRE